MKTGITGGIGSGKSYVCKRLQDRGFKVYDCDTEAKRLIRTSKTIRQQLKALIGEDAYIGKELNKAIVAQFLLESEENAQAIDRIVHPAVFKDLKELIQYRRMSLIDLVKQEHTERFRFDGIRQLSPIAISNISWGGSK